MSDLLATLLLGLKLAYLFGVSAGFAMFFAAIICRALEWSPVNITVNLNVRNPGDEEA
jgi:hypothetical protein